MALYEESEQWNLEGDCRKCRRKKYCKKPCSASKHAFNRDMARIVDQATGGMYSYVMNRAKVRRF